MGKGHEKTVLERKHTSNQQTHENIFNITYHQRDVNENHDEIPSHTSQNGNYLKSKKKKKKMMLVRVPRKRNT